MSGLPYKWHDQTVTWCHLKAVWGIGTVNSFFYYFYSGDNRGATFYTVYRVAIDKVLCVVLVATTPPTISLILKRPLYRPIQSNPIQSNHRNNALRVKYRITLSLSSLSLPQQGIHPQKYFSPPRGTLSRTYLPLIYIYIITRRITYLLRIFRGS